MEVEQAIAPMRMVKTFLAEVGEDKIKSRSERE